jgi:phage-related protein
MADIVERIIFDDSKALPQIKRIAEAFEEAAEAADGMNKAVTDTQEGIGKTVVDTNKQIQESTKKTADVERKALVDKIKSQEVYGISLRKITETLGDYKKNLIGLFGTLKGNILLTDQQKESAENLANSFTSLGKSILEGLKNPSQTLKSFGGVLADLGAAGVQSVKNLGSSIVTAFSNPGQTIKNFGSSLLNVGKSIFSLSNGLKVLGVGFNILKTTIAATGIGALVLALGSLVAFFTRTQKGADFLSQKFAGLKLAVGVLIDAFSTVGETIFNAFENPKQAIKDLGNAILDNIINRFKAIPLFLSAVADGFKAFFNRDTDGLKQAAKEAKEAFIQFGTGLDKEQQDKATEAIKKTVDAMKEANAEGEKLEKRKQELADAQIRLTKEEAEGRAAIAANKKDAEDTTKSYAQRIIAAQKAIGAEQSLLAKKFKEIE